MDEERDMSETKQDRLSTADLVHPRRDVSRDENPVEEFPAEGEAGVRLGTKPVLEVAREGYTPSDTQRLIGSVGTSTAGRSAPDLDREVTTHTSPSGGGATNATAARVAPSRTVDAPEGAPTGHAVSGTGAAVATAREIETGPLFSPDETKSFRERWDGIQVGFVDEPRRSVEQADSLVAAAMQRLAEQFSEERSRLEQQWIHGGDVSTEDLRLALQRYRSFFGRLLSV